jgi:glycosyltransferase involved in cell wall biosynthesis
MTLCSIVIPCYNEGRTVYELLSRVAAQPMPGGVDREIIVVDDGSRDDSLAAIRRFAAERPEVPLTILPGERNRGKGHAIRRALQVVRGEVVIIQDADLEYDPADYPALVMPIVLGLAPVVYGSRWLAPTMPMSGTLYSLGGWLENKFLHLLYRTNISDIATGYKAFRADVIKGLDLACEGFEFCPEVTAKLLNRKLTILEVPIRYRPRTKSEGKKIRWTDFFHALATIVRVRRKRL